MSEIRTDEKPGSRSGPALRWALVAGWMAAIFAMSSTPGTLLPSGAPGLGHLIEYSVLGGLLTFALLPSMSWRRAVALSILLASAYGITDELHQFLTPARTPDIADWGIDTISALLGASVVAFFALRRGRDQV